ncbi:MAG: T9SS type A sorting domain-containing protein [Saprospiraceae bacterium]|nr:T9SS type A sorting domain-containing protein [Saprospiraceae bacterium]
MEDYTLLITNNFSDDSETEQLRIGAETAATQQPQEVLMPDARAAMDNGFRVFPNPATSQATVAFHSTKEEAVEIQLFDLNGKPLRRSTAMAGFGENLFEMDLRGVFPGAYVLVLRAGGVVFRQRLVVLQGR